MTKAIVSKDTVDIVAARVRQFQEQGQLNLPADYSPENAMKSAWLALQNTQTRDKKPVLSACTQASIANSLLDMVVQGLNPAKKQCYFIAYGNQLVCQRSYFGAMAVAKMVRPDIAEIISEIVYAGDAFKYKIIRGRKEISNHEQALENIDGRKIKAAYCLIVGHGDKVIKTEIMSLEEIKQSWRQSQMNPVDDKGNIKAGSTHAKFTADMAKKTVINRACKPIINSSSDSHLFQQAAARSDEIRVEQEVAQEIAENANAMTIDIESGPREVDMETGEVLNAEPVEEQEPEQEPQAQVEPEMLAKTSMSIGGPPF
ncbi:MAG: RecT family recombinase [Candidatus Syntrophopropionicum ammoniitolerans]